MVFAFIQTHQHSLFVLYGLSSIATITYFCRRMIDILVIPETGLCNPDAKRLYDEILSGYNKLVRPVKNVTDPVTVKVKLKLSQLIDVVREDNKCVYHLNMSNVL